MLRGSASPKIGTSREATSGQTVKKQKIWTSAYYVGRL